MREAARDLDFEEAARLRDELKRLRETELAIADDPLAREVEGPSPASGREKGRHNKGRERHRTVDQADRDRFSPNLTSMRWAGPATTPAGRGRRALAVQEADRMTRRMAPTSACPATAGSSARTIWTK